MKKSGVGLWAGACVLAVAGSVALAAEDTKVQSAAKPSLTVTVTTPQTASLTQKISANGNLAAWQEGNNAANINSETTFDFAENSSHYMRASIKRSF